jgi:hypothetical protein
MLLCQPLQRFGDFTREPNTDVHHVSLGIHVSIIHHNGHKCKGLSHGKPALLHGCSAEVCGAILSSTPTKFAIIQASKRRICFG